MKGIELTFTAYAARQIKKGIFVFAEHYDKTGKIITKKEFDIIWKGGENYYYEVRRRFVKLLEDYLSYLAEQEEI